MHYFLFIDSLILKIYSKFFSHLLSFLKISTYHYCHLISSLVRVEYNSLLLSSNCAAFSLLNFVSWRQVVSILLLCITFTNFIVLSFKANVIPSDLAWTILFTHPCPLKCEILAHLRLHLNVIVACLPHLSIYLSVGNIVSLVTKNTQSFCVKFWVPEFVIRSVKIFYGWLSQD